MLVYTIILSLPELVDAEITIDKWVVGHQWLHNNLIINVIFLKANNFKATHMTKILLEMLRKVIVMKNEKCGSRDWHQLDTPRG